MAKAKAIARRLGVIKAFQLKQATRTHTHAGTHTNTDTMKSWKHSIPPFAVLFYQEFAASAIALIKRQKLQEAASPTLPLSFYLLLFQSLLATANQCEPARKQFIYCIPLNCRHSANLLKGGITLKANY